MESRTCLVGQVGTVFLSKNGRNLSKEKAGRSFFISKNQKMQVRDLLRALSEKQNGTTIHAGSMATKGRNDLWQR